MTTPLWRGRPGRPRERIGFLLRFSHAGTNEALALPALNPDFCTLRWTRPRMRLSLRKAARSAPEPPSCTGNPGERSFRVETLSQSAKALLPPHNRISCYAALSTGACAAFIEESRMKPVETTKLGRKSGTC